VIRHALAIAALPLTMTVVVPVWIARSQGVRFAAPADMVDRLLVIAGAACLGVGLALFVSSLRWFAAVGRGTLAPWDPPRRLVVGGPYQWVRNPMISGVLFVVFGEALVLRSVPHAGWALTFLIINLVYIPLWEEPGLERRFGDAYRRYRQHVPRFVPRHRRWRDEREEMTR
jgi:protein-S-isoprenylcysteine O-methyltransferase Ste14